MNPRHMVVTGLLHGAVCVGILAVRLAAPAYAQSGVTQPVAPATPALCSVGAGIQLSGTGKVSCNAPSADAVPRPAAPCQLTNVRLEGALAVDCDRYHGTGVRAEGAHTSTDAVRR